MIKIKNNFDNILKINNCINKNKKLEELLKFIYLYKVKNAKTVKNKQVIINKKLKDIELRTLISDELYELSFKRFFFLKKKNISNQEILKSINKYINNFLNLYFSSLKLEEKLYIESLLINIDNNIIKNNNKFNSNQRKILKI